MRLFNRAATLVAAVILTLACFGTASTKQPNIIIILVDDQDYHMNSLDHMDILQKELVQQGTLFTKHYGHISICCPARATLWTGKYAHNTNVTYISNDVPGGAWNHVQKGGYAKNYLLPWMQAAGYMTYYTGKIYNGYNLANYCNPTCLTGLDSADVLVEPTTYNYWNVSYTHFDGYQWKVNKRVPGYTTDQLGDNISGFIDQASKSGKPFIAVAAPVAPHIPTIPKPEYKDLYQDLKVPRNPNFNPDNRTGVAAVWQLDQLSDENVARLDDFYRTRQQCLKSVDDMLGEIIQKLTDVGELDNTFIFYTSDNGYHIGHHRLQGGKDQCFEEDINLPFLVRGPGVGKNQTSNLVTGHIDLAPTMLTLAGIDVSKHWDLDGTPITFPLESQTDYMRNVQSRSDQTHVEFWGPFRQEGWHNKTEDKIGVDYDVNVQTYKALRIQGDGYNLMYAVWCQDGAHELYDMSWDSYQLTNLHPDAPSVNGTNSYAMGMNTVLGRPTQHIIERLDALVLVLKTCSQDSCRFPWKQLHTDGKVNNLMDALSPDYDNFYRNSYAVAKVGWLECYKGLSMKSSSTLYSIANEHPVWLDQKIVNQVRSGSDRACSSASSWTVWMLAMFGLVAFVGL